MYDETAGTASDVYGFSPVRVISRHAGGYLYCSYDYETVADEKAAAFEKMKKDAMRIDGLWENEWLPEIRDHIAWWENFSVSKAPGEIS